MATPVITGKIILKSATKLSLDRRFTEIAKQVPVVQQVTPRIPQQANVTIPYSREDLLAGGRRANGGGDNFIRNRPAAIQDMASRLKKRSISYRLSMNNNYGTPSRVFQRVGGGGGPMGRRRRLGGANSYLFGGQNGMGIRLRGQGRVQSRMGVGRGGRGRGMNNNNNSPGRGRGGGVARFGAQNNNRVQNGTPRRSGVVRGGARGRGGNSRGNNNRGGRGRGGNRGQMQTPSVSKETLDDDLETYMAKTKLDSDFDLNAV